MSVSVREDVKGSGVWYVYVTVNGRRKAKKIGSKKIAFDVAAKIRAKLLLGDLDLEPKIVYKFKDFGLLWIEDKIRPVLRPSTTERYAGILRKYILPVFGEKPLEKISRGEVKSFLLHLHKAGTSRSTLALCRDVLSGILIEALDDGLISTNPVTGVIKSLKLDKKSKISVEPMNFEEVNLFLGTCKQLQPWHYPLFLTAFRTGMRMGELLGLEWRDIDFNGHFIMVKRAFKRKRCTAQKRTRNGGLICRINCMMC